MFISANHSSGHAWGSQVEKFIADLQLSQGKSVSSSATPSTQNINSTLHNFLSQLAQVFPQLQNLGSQAEVQQLWQFLQNNFNGNLSQQGVQQKLAELLIFAQEHLSAPLANKLDALVQQSLNLPGDITSSPLTAELNTALQALAQNDFAQFQKLMPNLWNNLPANVAHDFNALASLLAPLQELQALGCPPEIKPQTVQNWLQNLQSLLAIPSPSQSNIPAGLQEFSLVHQANQASFLVPTGQSDVQIPLPPHWQNALAHLDSNSQLLASVLHRQNAAPEFIFNLPGQIAANQGAISGLVSGGNQASVFVLPHLASQWIPGDEFAFWQKSALPVSPNMVEAANFIREFGDLPANPAILQDFAQSIHQLELLLEPGQNLSDSQKELALRWVLMNSTLAQSSAPEALQLYNILQQSQNLPLGLESFSTDNQGEAALFKLLSAPTQEAWQQEFAKSPLPLKESQLLQWVENSLQSGATLPQDKEVLQNLQKQLQWSQFDLHSRHPDHREEVFYLMQGGELQKYRLQISREGGGKQQKQPNLEQISFYIETSTAKLGDVRVNISAKEGELHLEFRDSVGSASAAVQAERESLAQELGEIGWRLITLQYQLPFKKEMLKSEGKTKNHIKTSFLDLKA